MPKRSLFLAILSAILFLTGCTAQTPTTPPFELPSSFGISGEAEPVQKWWQQFNSAELNNAVETALGSNFTIKVALERVNEMKAAVQQAGAPLLPEANIKGEVAHQQKNSSDSNKNFSLGAAASYELDLWGRLRAIRNAANAEFLASRETLNTAALTIAAETAVTWLSCMENRMQITLVKKQQEVNRKTEEIIEFKVRTGQTEIADLLQQRQLVKKNEATLASLSAAAVQQKHRLNILLGRLPKNEYVFPKETRLPDLPKLPATGVPATLLQRRPDVHRAWLALAAADQRTTAAIASRLPALSLRASIETSASHSRELFSNWLTTLAGNLLAPIFDGGNRKAEVSRREGATKQQYDLWAESILEALQEVENALTEEHSLSQQLASNRQQLKLARDTVEALTRRYRMGATNYQRVLQATLSEQELEREQLATRLQLLSKRIELYRALSGGLPDTLFQPEPANNG